jgi:Zn-finger nucleic acid-binding protein
MNCPACSNELTQMTVADVTIDICKNGCGGIWFDNFELKKFDEPNESAGAELLDIERNPNVKVDHNRRFNCPKCDGIVMMRHFFSVKHKVQIDECPSCAGIWLDAGELGQLRELFDSEEARHQAADEYFQQVFGKEFAAMEAEDDAKLAKAQKFANMFKWICPSAYIPGKQTWGAF